MQAEGTGGRSFPGGDNSVVINGVRTTDTRDVVRHPKKRGSWVMCSHLKCTRAFWTRQEGDMFCSEACEVSACPQFRGNRK